MEQRLKATIVTPRFNSHGVVIGFYTNSGVTRDFPEVRPVESLKETRHMRLKDLEEDTIFIHEDELFKRLNPEQDLDTMCQVLLFGKVRESKTVFILTTPRKEWLFLNKDVRTVDLLIN